MDKQKVLFEVQRLRDVAKAVAVCGKMDTDKHSPEVISVICEMQMMSTEWLWTLKKAMKPNGKACTDSYA
jgi:hypothetical protein